jgi:low temperature requirement protein LtrA
VFGEARLRDPDERTQAAPLELFFDLVFVATIGEVTADFVSRPTLERLLDAVVLFIPVVWTWTVVVLYTNRFDTEDAVHRILKSASMVGVAFMGIAATQAFGDRGWLFVMGFVLARAIVLLMYVRSAPHVDDVELRATMRRYVAGLTVGALLWVMTFALAPDVRPYAGVAVVAYEFLLLWTTWRPVNVSHLTERLGLFTILVLGEGWLAIVGGVSHAGLQADVLVVAGCLLVMAVLVWWAYYDFTEASVLNDARIGPLALLVHIAIFIALGIAGAGAELLVEEAASGHTSIAVRLSLLAGIGVFVGGLATLRALARSAGSGPMVVRLAAVGFAVVATFIGLSPTMVGIVGVAVLSAAFAAEVRDGTPRLSQREAAT